MLEIQHTNVVFPYVNTDSIASFQKTTQMLYSRMSIQIQKPVFKKPHKCCIPLCQYRFKNQFSKNHTNVVFPYVNTDSKASFQKTTMMEDTTIVF